MRKYAIFALLVLFCSGCTKTVTIQQEIKAYSPEVVQKVYDHTISVATIYAMSQAEWSKRMMQRQRDNARVKFFSDGTITKESLAHPPIIIPINISLKDAEDNPIKFLAYIGSATILKENYAVTVSHLFSHEEGTIGYQIWAFKDGFDHAIECDLIVRTDIEKNWITDYAIIKLREDLGLPGLKIAKVEPTAGDFVIFSGSVGGLAFFTRFGHIAYLRAYFNTGDDGKLHLTPFDGDYFYIIYPSGPGDSGGSIKNRDGDIIGIMYVGIEVYSEEYVFSNRLPTLQKFLTDAGLSRIGE